MSARGCMSEDRLIDFIEGEVTGEEAGVITRHLGKCPACAAAEASLRRARGLAAGDRVPEPDPAYWAYFQANVRRRIESRAASGRRRMRLVMIPGIAAAAACAALVVFYARGPVGPEPDLDAVVAEMNASVVAEEMLAASAVEELLFGQIDSDAGLLEEYLVETGDLGEMLGGLSGDEERDLINRLSSLMELRGSSGESARKGC